MLAFQEWGSLCVGPQAYLKGLGTQEKALSTSVRHKNMNKIECARQIKVFIITQAKCIEGQGKSNHTSTFVFRASGPPRLFLDEQKS